MTHGILLIQQAALEFNQMRLHQRETVLITDVNPSDRTALGRSSREVPEEDGEILLHYQGQPPAVGTFVSAEITGAGPYDLIGECT